MVEIEFSYIQDFEDDEKIWSAIVDDFRAQHGVQVRLRSMTWDTAWVELFSFGSNDKGPHVSHIGNSWVTSLARMNVLRPFKPEELTCIGGAWDFVTPNWETGVVPGDKRVWAIPWTAWTHVICYRKNLLEQVGVDPSNAFGTIQNARTTIRRLATSSLETPWLNAKLPSSFRDSLHIAASWIWAAGGDFFEKGGTKALFSNPQAIDGLKDWLEMYCAVPASYQKLAESEILELFRSGNAAAILTDIRVANSFIKNEMENNPTVCNNLGIAPVTEVPWTGGGSFVIWDYARANLTQEKAAVELIKFLTSKEINIRYQKVSNSMPSRMDALHEIYLPDNPAREAIMLAATKGRGYANNIPSWRRVEQQLGDAISTVMHEIIENPSEDPATVLHTHLDGLAERVTNLLR
jgi:multiple sugar transport system substrate-binding protein